MTARRHPGGHLGGLHKRTELGILENKIGAHGRAIRSIARRRRSIVEPRDSLLQRAFDAVRGDDEGRIEHFTTRELDVWTTRDGRVGLSGANGGTEADTYAGCSAGEVMEYRVVRAMDVMVRRAMIAGHARAQARVSYAHARVVSPKDDRSGFDAVLVGSTPAQQESRRLALSETRLGSPRQWRPQIRAACRGALRAWTCESLRGRQCTR